VRTSPRSLGRTIMTSAASPIKTATIGKTSFGLDCMICCQDFRPCGFTIIPGKSPRWNSLVYFRKRSKNGSKIELCTSLKDRKRFKNDASRCALRYRHNVAPVSIPWLQCQREWQCSVPAWRRRICPPATKAFQAQAGPAAMAVAPVHRVLPERLSELGPCPARPP